MNVPAAIQADESKLNQIVSNLLSNAIKYAPGGGEIRLAAAPDGPDHVVITVQDHGVGMTPEQVARLFHKYERLERDAIRGIPGTGLGLYLIKHLVELHGGEISCESAPGQGSAFRVRLPVEIDRMDSMSQN